MNDVNFYFFERVRFRIAKVCLKTVLKNGEAMKLYFLSITIIRVLKKILLLQQSSFSQR